MEGQHDYKANFVILSEKNLIIEFHDGTILAEFLITYKKKQALHKEFSPHHNLLVDLRYAKFTKRVDKVQKYVNFLEHHHEIAGTRNVALLADSPDPVVMSTLYQSMQSNLPQNLKIFASLENAIQWLGADIRVEKVNTILEILRST